MPARPLRALLGLCAAAVLLLAALPSAAVATHTSSHVLPAYGLNSLWAEGLADFELGIADLGRMNGADIGLYRARFRQDKVLKNGTYSDWTQLDRLAREAAYKRVALVPVVINMPGEVYTPPKTASARNEFARFVAAAARRYGSAGSFWASCGCPKQPALVWEIWNEQNFSLYWNAPSPTEYAQLLTAVRRELRKADSSGRVMFGGLGYASSYNGTTAIDPNTFLRQALEAAGAGSFDALALHSYHGDATRGVNTAIAGTVTVLKTSGGTDASGAPRHQVWVNEFGKPTRADDPTTSVNEQATSEAAQRDWLNTFLDNLLPRRSEWNLGPVFWYALRDSNAPTQAWHRLGLRRTTSDNRDGGAKPAWDAYVGRSTGAEPLNLPVLAR